MKKMTIVAVVSTMAVLAAAAGGVLALRGGSTVLADTAGVPATDVTGTASGTAEVAPLAQQASASMPTSEGLIYAGEYRNSLYEPTTGMSLFWQNDATNLYVGLVSPGTGWAGVGFSNRYGKPGSNIILGAVSNGTVTIQDNYGVTKELHLVDRASSLLAMGGSESAGETTLEFVIPLASGDSQDVSLVPGQTVAVILAYQATRDSFTAEHTRYSQLQITLD
jgi:secreted trypsin-like serine protease